MERPIQCHDAGKLREAISTLCKAIWHGSLPAGSHLWSIPADPDRDFDIILSDAVTELENRRRIMNDSGIAFPDNITR